MTKAVRVTIAVVVWLTAGVSRAQEPSLTAARDLYVAAEYTSALTMLNALAGTTLSKSDRQGIDLYRALCLVALGNAPEATTVIEGLVSSDLLYKPDLNDLPPRMRTVFTDARKRLLPSLVQQRYLVARAAFEQKEFATAAESFKLVLDGLDDPDLEASGSQPPLSDLKMLAAGFHDLAAKASAPPETRADADTSARTDAGVDARPSASSASTAVEPGAGAAAGVPHIYEGSDTDVVPPITVRQVVPPFPGRLLRGATATVELVINETGSVDSASMVVPLNPQFDRGVIEATRTWQYRPATRNGTPVKFRKRLLLSVLPGER